MPTSIKEPSGERLTAEERSRLLSTWAGVQALWEVSVKEGHVHDCHPREVGEINRTGKRLRATLEAVLKAEGVAVEVQRARDRESGPADVLALVEASPKAEVTQALRELARVAGEVARQLEGGPPTR